MDEMFNFEIITGEYLFIRIVAEKALKEQLHMYV